jgi:hypothetical protein
MPANANPPDSPNESQSIVVILGDFGHEGLTAKIESLGFETINKRLRSGPRNWERIADLLTALRNQAA